MNLRKGFFRLAIIVSIITGILTAMRAANDLVNSHEAIKSSLKHRFNKLSNDKDFFIKILYRMKKCREDLEYVFISTKTRKAISDYCFEKSVRIWPQDNFSSLPNSTKFQIKQFLIDRSIANEIEPDSVIKRNLQKIISDQLQKELKLKDEQLSNIKILIHGYISFAKGFLPVWCFYLIIYFTINRFPNQFIKRKLKEVADLIRKVSGFPPNKKAEGVMKSKLNLNQWIVFIAFVLILILEISFFDFKWTPSGIHTPQYKIEPFLYIALTCGVGVFLYWALGDKE